MKIIKTYLVPFLIIVCGIITMIMSKRIQDLNRDLSIAVNNEKAYVAENSALQEKNRVFQLTLNQMTYYTDSLLIKMKQMANEVGIKDRKIKSLQYMLETYSKTDTITLRDTIFRENFTSLDTCIIDDWNRTCIHLAYPNVFALDHKYKNEKYIICDYNKEPIKPRKWFLPRWFTKKQTVIEIVVVDQNPNADTPRQRFVEIIK